MKKSHNLKVGDIVRVKPKVKDPDFGFDIGGCQGRVSEIRQQDNVLYINWDSWTLKSTPGSIIAQCEEKGLDWSQICLDLSDVEPASARDTEADVAKALSKLQTEHTWDHLGEEGVSISKVLAGLDPDDEWAAFETWETHLHKVLNFPFEAEAADFQTRGPLQSGDKVMVKSIADVVDSDGVIVLVQHKRRTYHFPLCDLEATDKGSANHDFIREYAVWVANH